MGGQRFLAARRSVPWVGAAVCLVVCGCAKNHAEPKPPAAPATPAEAAAGPAEPHLTLDTEQRDYLWQIEHHGLVLGKHGFAALKKALAAGDAAALRALLAPDFAGEVDREPQEVAVATDWLRVARRQDSGRGRARLDAAGFVELLLGFRKQFARPPQAQTNLMRLAPAERGNLGCPHWEGSCQLRLWGEAQPGRPAEVVLNLEFRIDAPTPENLGRKGWLHTAAVAQSLVGEAHRFLFRDVARERGVAVDRLHDNWKLPLGERKTNTGGVYLCDFDRDGYLDLLVVDVSSYFLYRGLPGGKFADVTTAVGLPRIPDVGADWAYVAAIFDADGDGWEDLILGGHVYRNDGGKRFVDYTYRTNLRLPLDAAGVAIADYDRDGRVDLYVTRPGKPKADSWLRGHSGHSKGNQLWRNKGDWQFEEVTERAGAAGGHRSTFSAVWLDADNDGWPDLYVINEFGNGVLLVNRQDGTFREHAIADGPSDFGTMGVTCGDIDNDGRIDLYLANMYSKAGTRVIGNMRRGTYPEEIMAKLRQFVAGSQLYQNRGGLQFEKRGAQCQVAAVGWAYGAALADLDNDGWLDLYATAGFMSQSRDDPDG